MSEKATEKLGTSSKIGAFLAAGEQGLPFIGRERELSMMSELYSRACRDGERLLMVRGDAGVGKTRLLHEFKRRMKLAGTLVLEGRCTAQNTSYQPFAHILASGMSFLEDVGEVDRVNLSPLASLFEEGGPAPDSSVSMEEKARFLDAYTRFLCTLSSVKNPVILLHGLHMADPGTLELLLYLIDGTGPWGESIVPEETFYGLVVGSMKKPGRKSASVLRTLAEHPKSDVIKLSGFDKSGVREFLQSPAVVSRFHSLTSGRPDELDALVKLPKRGAKELFEGRFLPLDPNLKHLLHVLAVFGHPLSPDRLGRMAGKGVSGKDIEGLISSGIVHSRISEGEIILFIPGDSDRDRVLRTLDDASRRECHAGIARTLEALNPAGLALEDLARHSLDAGDSEKGVTYAIGASDALYHAFSFTAASDLLQKAQEHAPASLRPEIAERMTELSALLGDYETAREQCRRLCSLRPDSVSAHRRLGELAGLAGEYSLARDSLNKAWLMSKEQALSDEEDGLLAALAEVEYQQGDYEAACGRLERLVTSEEEEHSPGVLLKARNTWSKILLAQGRWDESFEFFEANLAMAHEHGLKREEAVALINMGIARLGLKDNQAASERFAEAVALAEDLGLLREEAVARENLAALAHLQRNYASALEHYHAAVRCLKKLGNRDLLRRVSHNLGELYLRLGDITRAGQLLKFARRMTVPEGGKSVSAEGLLLEGRISLLKGDTDQARSVFRQAYDTSLAVGEEHTAVEARLAEVHVDIAEGKVKEAENRLETIEDKTLDMPRRRAEALLLSAEIEQSAGRDAEKGFADAILVFAEVGDSEGVFRAGLKLGLLFKSRNMIADAKRQMRLAVEANDKIRHSVPEAFLESFDAHPERAGLSAMGDLDEMESPERETGDFADQPRETASPCSNTWSEKYPDMIGRSPAMSRIFTSIDKVSETDSLVLLTGESGTGKELAAEAIHSNSSRRHGPLVKVNCAALVETLLLSELFGHERGAFTGAVSRRQGCFEAAGGGTVFLDEIGDISPRTQVALLRVVEKKSFMRVGGSRPIRVDVRIICATNRDLEKLVYEGVFREDLYYRLSGVQIHMPPLREKVEDIPLLAQKILEDISLERSKPGLSLSEDALIELMKFRWPGNVRELENVLRSASLFVEDKVIEAGHLARFSDALSSNGLHSVADESDSRINEVIEGRMSLLEQKKKLEFDCISEALEKCGGNITHASKMLGMKRPRLSQLVKQYGIATSGRKNKEPEGGMESISLVKD